METNIVNTPRRLVRGNGPIAGVAGGLGDYFGVDPTVIRLGLVVTGVLTFPAIPVAYVAAWLIIPKPDAVQGPMPAPAPQPMAPVAYPAPPPPMPDAPAPNPWAAPGVVETPEPQPVEVDETNETEADETQPVEEAEKAEGPDTKGTES